MSDTTGQTAAPATPSRTLQLMLDRLLASMVSGPAMNCRPQNSRQRIDFASLSRFDDVDPSLGLRQLLGEEAKLTVLAKRPAPRRGRDARGRIRLDDPALSISAQPERRLTRIETGLVPSDVCYVLYTSGTTGRPKGVVTEHRNVTHFVAAFNNACFTTREDRIYQGFALGFDGSTEEIWMAFSNGATLVVGTPLGLAMLAWLYLGGPAVPGPLVLLHAHVQVFGFFATLIPGVAAHLLAGAEVFTCPMAAPPAPPVDPSRA